MREAWHYTLLHGRRFGHCIQQPTDIYSLFGNALENAIEAVGKVSNPEKRRIALVLRSEWAWPRSMLRTISWDRLSS